MRLLYRWTLCKQEGEPQLNEDASTCNNAHGTFVVSDGASESYAARRWARVLVSRYVRRPLIDEDWLAQAIATYAAPFNRATMSWSAQAAFDRGSFATLLGLRCDPAGVSILGIGDSLAVLDNGSDVCATFPYNEAEQFLADPLLLSTVQQRNTGILKPKIFTRWSFDKIESPRVFCMTDAIGAWLLSERVERMAQVRALQTWCDFVALVEAARADGTMRRDDTTLLVIG